MKVQHFRPVDLLWMFFIALSYWAFARFALSYLSLNEIAILWPSAGIAWAALLLLGERFWPAILIGSYAAESLTGVSGSWVYLTTLGNTLEPLLAVWMLGKFGFDRTLLNLRDYLIFLATALTVTLVSATFGTVSAWLSGLATQADVLGSFFRWWMGNVLGALLAVPILISPQLRQEGLTRRWLETFALFCITQLFCALVFLGLADETLGPVAKAYWGFPLIIWSAVRFGTVGVSLVLLTIDAAVLIGIVNGSGYFSHDREQTGLFNLWFYLVTIQLTGMSLAILLKSNERANQSLQREKGLLEQSEKNLKQYLGFTPVPMAISESGSGQVVFLNRAFKELFGYGEDSIQNIQDWFRLFFPDPHYRWHFQQAWESYLTNRSDDHLPLPQEFSVTCKNGMVRKVELQIAPSEPYLLVAFIDNTQKHRDKELIWRQAHYDALTELPNRRLFMERLQTGIEQSQRLGQSLALLLIDLDRFKEVNDTFGHDVGDQLLVNATRRILACISPKDTVARLGGDEFTVILPMLNHSGEIDHIAQSIIDSLSEPIALGDEMVLVSASIGITCYPQDGTDSKTLLKNADQALFETKNLGRNGYSYFTLALHEAAQSRLTLIRELRSALNSGELRVHYQPIIHLETGKVTKAEALLRWLHPNRGTISPIHFIAVAEDIGLICEIGDWVFQQAVQQAKRWLTLGFAIQVSVNKSARQFMSGNSQETWVQYLQTIGLPGEQIVIEITENLLLDDRPELQIKMQQLRAAGIQVSIDDFGTGYSSLSYLKKFEVDYLKIDRAFIRDIDSDASDLALAEAIIVMAHKLGLQVIAEGVETESQRQILLDSGCDFAQGYLFSEALTGEQFAGFISTWNQTHQISPL